MCNFFREISAELKIITSAVTRLNLLQHFPTFRESDRSCTEYDIPEIELYRENWEVLSKSATEFLQKRLKPLVAFSGHSHHYCRLNNSWGLEEFTVASFSWRNKQNPSFLLVG